MEKGHRSQPALEGLFSAVPVLHTQHQIQLGTIKIPEENSSSQHFVPTDLKQTSDNPIQNVPLGLPTDSNAAYEEGARPGILKAQQ